MSLFTGILFCAIIRLYWKGWVSIYGPQERGFDMPVSKSQQKAVHKYVKANYDRLELTVPKGRKEIIKAHAESRGESVNGFINRAIDAAMERDTATSKE